MRLRPLVVLALLWLASDAGRSVLPRWSNLPTEVPSSGGAAVLPPHSSPPGSPEQRGQYLVNASLCGTCHSPVTKEGSPIPELAFAGGVRIDAGVHGVFFSANLTSDAETGLGDRSIEEIVGAIRFGHRRDRRINTWVMPWNAFGSFEDADAAAIASYLKSLPPIRNAVPAAMTYGTLETVVRKLSSAWPELRPEALRIDSGNAGSATPSWLAAERALVWLQRIAFVLLALIAVFGRRPADPEDSHVGLPMIGGALAFIALAAIAFVERFPAIAPIPAGLAIGGFASSVPAASDDEAARRGRYLFTVTSCAYCHSPDGSGGMRIGGRGFPEMQVPSLGGGGERWTTAEALRLAMENPVATQGAGGGRVLRLPVHHGLGDADLADLAAFLRGLPATAGQSGSGGGTNDSGHVLTIKFPER